MKNERTNRDLVGIGTVLVILGLAVTFWLLAMGGQ
jgi:hypothetical protein